MATGPVSKVLASPDKVRAIPNHYSELKMPQKVRDDLPPRSEVPGNEIGKPRLTGPTAWMTPSGRTRMTLRQETVILLA